MRTDMAQLESLCTILQTRLKMNENLVLNIHVGHQSKLDRVFLDALLKLSPLLGMQVQFHAIAIRLRGCDSPVIT
jgi:hypothetical protein